MKQIYTQSKLYLNSISFSWRIWTRVIHAINVYIPKDYSFQYFKVKLANLSINARKIKNLEWQSEGKIVSQPSLAQFFAFKNSIFGNDDMY